MRVKSLFLIALLLVTAGCAEKHIALQNEKAQKIQASAAYLVVGQEELEAEIERSNVAGALGGGLLPALIDVAVESHRSKSAEEVIAPLREHLVDVDYRTELLGKLETRLESMPWLKCQEATCTVKLSERDRKALVDDGQRNAVLVVNSNYKLEPAFRYLKVQADVELWVEGEKEPIYRNSFFVSSDAVEGKTKEEAAEKWADNGGEKLKEAIRKGMDSLVETIAADLRPVVPEAQASITPASNKL